MPSTLIELGEAEGDEASVTEGEAAIRKLAGRGRAPPGRDAALRRGRRATTPISRSMPAPAAPRARTGPRCCCACTSRWAEQHGYKVERARDAPTARRPASSRATLLIKGHNAYGWLKTESGVHRLVRISPFDFERAPAHQLRQRLGLSGGRRHDRDRHQGERLPHRHLPLVGRRRPARQHDRFGGAHHAHADRHRGRLPAGALAAQEPRHRLEHAARRASTRSS